MGKKLECADLSSPGVKFGEAARSLKRYKNSKAYRDELRRLLDAPIPTTGSPMEKRKITVSRMEAQSELDMLRTGESADIFSGVIKFQPPTED
jgi:hypothetical protein